MSYRIAGIDVHKKMLAVVGKQRQLAGLSPAFVRSVDGASSSGPPLPCP